MTLPEAGALIQRNVEFSIFSNALSADEDIILKELGMTEPDGKKRLRTTASSTIKDLSGDEMTGKALETMRSSAEGNMTIFLNHKYLVPEDVLGSVEKATLIDKGNNLVDLDLIVRVNESNPRAVQTHQSIVDGTKLGCSIGALIPAGGATKTETGLQIDEVQLLEASIVGIPANPRSFVQYATKAYQKALIDDAPEDEIEMSGPPKPALKGEDGASQSGLPTLATVGEDGPETISKMETVEAAEDTLSKESAPPAEGDEGDPDAGDEPADDAGEAPAEETTEATQDAPSAESTPENDGVADEAAVDKQVALAKSFGLDALADLLKEVTSQLVAKHEELRVEKEARIAAETRASDAEADVAVAKEIVSIIETLPMGRRTAFKEQTTAFRKRIGGVYNDDVIDLIERGSKGVQ